MSRLFYHTMQDNAGNLLFGVSGTMRLAGSGTLATIYGDEALTVILPNPMTNHPSFGSFKCFLGAGDYDFYMAKAGYTFETLTGVQGHGTMAQQDADDVLITGGGATLSGLLVEGPVGIQTPINPSYSLGTQGAVNVGGALNVGGPSTHAQGLIVANMTGNDKAALYSDLLATGGTNRRFVFGSGTAPSYFGGEVQVNAKLAVGANVTPDAQSFVFYPRQTLYGLKIQPSDNDTGSGSAVVLANAAGIAVGSIHTDGASTAFNTTSDARLKTAITTLIGELAVIRALRPVRFRWLSDDSEGVGFLAQEVAEHVQGVVTGEADAVDDEGRIVPQMIDYSKLVPWLVGAVQTLASQVETLTERVQVLEEGLGV